MATETPDPRPPEPLVIRQGQLVFERSGLPRKPFDDFYHRVLRSTWRGFLGTTTGLYAAINVLFALLYLAGGDCINAEHPGSFLEAFSFSVQTFSTIGYGTMSPTTPWAHGVVFVESLVGLLGVALMTGVSFAKFARPVARVSFSEAVVVTTRNGRPVLSFRMANERNSRIIDAQCQVYVLIEETSTEGELMRRFYPLHLERERSPVFLLTWSVFHFLDGNSPLAGITENTVQQRMVSLVAILMGTDDGLVQTVHAQHYYLPANLRFGHRFVDLIERHPGGGMVIHHDRLHDTMPQSEAAVTNGQRVEQTP